MGPYWFCFLAVGRGLCSVSDKFPLVFSSDKYSFEYGVWKYSSTKPRISNLIYVCILSLNTNSCAHIHLSHVWPSAVRSSYTNKCSQFYEIVAGTAGVSKPTCIFKSYFTNKKRTNIGRSQVWNLLTFRVSLWAEESIFWPKNKENM